MTADPNPLTDEELNALKARRSTRTFKAGEHNEICEHLPPHFSKRASVELDRYEADIAAVIATIAERDRRIAELENRTDAPSAEEWEELARIKIPGQRSAPVKLRAFVETDVEFQWDMDRWVARIHATEQQTIDHAIPSEILTYGWHKPEE